MKGLCRWLWGKSSGSRGFFEHEREGDVDSTNKLDAPLYHQAHAPSRHLETPFVELEGIYESKSQFKCTETSEFHKCPLILSGPKNQCESV